MSVCINNNFRNLNNNNNINQDSQFQLVESGGGGKLPIPSSSLKKPIWLAVSNNGTLYQGRKKMFHKAKKKDNFQKCVTFHYTQEYKTIEKEILRSTSTEAINKLCFKTLEIQEKSSEVELTGLQFDTLNNHYMFCMRLINERLNLLENSVEQLENISGIITENHLNKEGLFRVPGSKDRIDAAMVKLLNTGNIANLEDIEDVAVLTGIYKQIIMNLNEHEPQGIIPAPVLNEVPEECTVEDIVQSLNAHCSKNALLALKSCLELCRQIAANEDETKMNLDNLTTTPMASFYKATEQDPLKASLEIQKFSSFSKHLLENAEEIVKNL